MNSEAYINTLEDSYGSYGNAILNNEGEAEKFVLTQGGAPSRTAWQSLRQVKKLFSNPLPCCQPSPDLSPCDYFTWGAEDKIAQAQKSRSLAQLKNAIAYALFNDFRHFLGQLTCDFS